MLDGAGVSGAKESSNGSKSLHGDLMRVVVEGCVQLNGVIKSDAVPEIVASFYTENTV